MPELPRALFLTLIRADLIALIWAFNNAYYSHPGLVSNLLNSNLVALLDYDLILGLFFQTSIHAWSFSTSRGLSFHSYDLGSLITCDFPL